MNKIGKYLFACLVALSVAPAAFFSLAHGHEPAQEVRAVDPVQIVSVGGNPVAEEADFDAGSFPVGKIGELYSAKLEATGGSGEYEWSIVWGGLVDGLFLDADTGLVSGTPTAGWVGSNTFKVTDKNDPSNYDVENLSMFFYDDSDLPTIVTTTIPGAVAGKDYSVTLDAESASSLTIDWSVVEGELPPGIELGKVGSWDGLLSGTPTEVGSYSFTLKAKSLLGEDTQAYTLVVDEALTVTAAPGPYYLGDTVQFTASIGNDKVDWTLFDGTTSAKTMLSDAGLLTIGEDETEWQIIVFARSKTNVNNYASEYIDITLSKAYSITVHGGVATDWSGNPITRAGYGEGFMLKAPAIPGKEFSKWTLEAGSAELSILSPESMETTAYMPDGDVIVKANYVTMIESVVATFDKPINGQHVDKTIETGSTSYKATLENVWVDETYFDPDTGVYVAGKEYVYYIKFEANDGYMLADGLGLSVTINGIDLPYGNYAGGSTWLIALTAESDEKPQYNVNVVGGIATPTIAEEGDTVTVTAAPAEKGYAFDKWTSDDVTFADPASETTTFEMPAKEVTVTATYKEVATPHHVTANYCTANPTDAVAGVTVAVTANDPADGYEFDKWVSPDVAFADETKASTTFVMPDKDVTVTATYKQTTVTLVSISVSGQKTAFKVGDDFFFGGVVTAHYDNGSEEDVTTFASFSGYDMNKEGKQTVLVSYNSKITTYEITVQAEDVPTLVSIAVSGQKTAFYVGDEFTFGGKVMAHFDKGEDQDVTAFAAFTGYDMSKVGEQTVTVTYQGKTAEYKINVAEKPVPKPVSISVSGQKTTFKVGDDFLFGGVVTAHYDNGGKDQDVTNDAAFSGYDLSKAGEQTVTVSYQGKTTTYEITVSEESQPTLLSIAVSGQKTAFTVGDEFTFGGKVMAHFDKGEDQDVTAFAAFTGYDMSKVGEQTVTVTYQGKTAEYKINVSEEPVAPVLESISVSGQKTTFTVGDEFSFGGKVMAHFDKGEDQDVTSEATFSGYDMSKEGEQTVTVTYQGKTVTYTITVQAKGEPLPPEGGQGGLPGGAIAGIVIGSTLVAGLGGFSIFWFLIKKKSWADFILLFKKK